MRGSVLGPAAAGVLALVLLSGGALAATPSAGPSASPGPRWDRVSLDPAVAAGARMTDVTVGGPGYVAVGMDEAGFAVSWTSADGRTWERHALPHSREFPQVAGGRGSPFDPEGPIVAARDGLVVVIERGQTLPDAGLQGFNARRLWTSPDGVAWTLVPSREAGLDPLTTVKAPGLGLTPGPLLDLLATDAGFVGVGWAGYRGRIVPEIATSGDGTSWTMTRERTSLVQPPKQTARLPFTDLPLAAVTRSGEELLAVADRGTLYDAVLGRADADILLVHATDGSAWRITEPRGLGGKGDQVGRAVAASGDREVIVGGTRKKSGSSAPLQVAAWVGSGSDWRPAAVDRPQGVGPAAVTIAAVALDPAGGFVATGWWTDDAGTHPKAWSSPDGSHWTLVPAAEIAPAGTAAPSPSAPASAGPSPSAPAASQASPDTRMEAIAAGPSGLIAVGRAPEGAAVWIAAP